VDGKPIAVFDLDGTLVRTDTLMPFLLTYCWRHRRLARMLPVPVWAGLYACRLASDRTAKERILRSVVGGRPWQEVEEHARWFARDWAPRRWNEEVVGRLREHQARGDRVVLLSASPDLYVGQIAAVLGVEVCLSTRVRRDGATVCGRLEGANCKGQQKRIVLEQWLGAAVAPPGSSAYGDSHSDRFVLEWVDHGFLVTRRGLRPWRVEPTRQEPALRPEGVG
jgi:phosphatidylglycerophosphatase C